MIKVTFFCLVLFLVIMIAVSYMSQEGFADPMITLKDAREGDLIFCGEKMPYRVMADGTIRSVVSNEIGRSWIPNIDLVKKIITKDCNTLKKGLPLTMKGTETTTVAIPTEKQLQEKSELMQTIQQAVRNELLANRLSNPIVQDPPVQTPAVSQGKEYDASCDSCDVHDMSCSNTKMRLW